MDAITIVVFIGSMVLAGEIAEYRGRSIKTWVWTAAVIGPLALPLVFLLPNQTRQPDANVLPNR